MKFLLAGIILFFSSLFYYNYSIIKEADMKLPPIISSMDKPADIKLHFSDLSEHRKAILLKVVDPGFYNHTGIDLHTPGAGLTTITADLVAMMLRKELMHSKLAIWKQLIIARYSLNKLLPKTNQLDIYINHCDFGYYNGENVRGIAAASISYFGKPYNKLLDDEFISLVAMLINPAVFNPYRYPDRNFDRVDRIKELISGDYKPLGLMDLYYGGKTYAPKKGPLKDILHKLVWGY